MVASSAQCASSMTSTAGRPSLEGRRSFLTRASMANRSLSPVSASSGKASRNGPSARGVADPSHTPRSRRTSPATRPVQASTKVVLPRPASPPISAKTPEPATTSAKFRSRFASSRSRSSSSTPSAYEHVQRNSWRFTVATGHHVLPGEAVQLVDDGEQVTEVVEVDRDEVGQLAPFPLALPQMREQHTALVHSTGGADQRADAADPVVDEQDRGVRRPAPEAAGKRCLRRVVVGRVLDEVGGAHQPWVRAAAAVVFHEHHDALSGGDELTQRRPRL